MNETEFETRVAVILRDLLPTLTPADISEQYSFSMKFGHHNVIVDGKDPGNYAKRSIYDVLVTFKQRPLILLELKKPGNGISAEDIDQGVSYARLTHPITPITVISCGDETKIINTYTKEEYKSKNLSTQQVLDSMNEGLKLAADDAENSIKELLENDQRILYDIINTISQEAFDERIGTFSELDKPIIRNFQIKRETPKSLNELFTNENAIFITGDRYCGKTNFLYQLFTLAKNKGYAFFYTDCNDPNYSIFQKLSNFVTRKIKYPVSIDRIRRWILIDMNQENQKKLIIAYDHFQFRSSEAIKAEVTEVVDIFNGSNNLVLLASDFNNYHALCHVEGSEAQTFYKSRFKNHKLKYFSQTEFIQANELLFKINNTRIMQGGEYAGAYRNPRIWRWLANSSNDERPDEVSWAFIKAVPTIDFLNLITQKVHASPQTLVDFKKLTEAYIETLFSDDLNPNLRLMALNMSVLSEEKINTTLDEISKGRLIDSSLMEKTLTLEHTWAYIPKIPELMAKFSIEILEKIFLNILKENFDAGYRKMLTICEYLPYGEIIAAKIIATYCFAGEETLVYEIFKRLQNDKPLHEIHDSEMQLRIFLPNEGYQDITTTEGEVQKSVTNYFPYLVLSHLIGYSFMTSEQDPHMTHKRCIAFIASEKTQQQSLHINTFFELQPSTIELDNTGALIVGDEGITEPIVQSLQAVLIENPQIIVEMIDFLIKHKGHAIFHRIYIAAKYSYMLVSAQQQGILLNIMKRYRENIAKFIAHGISPKGAKREDLRRQEKEIKKFRIHKDTMMNLL